MNPEATSNVIHSRIPRRPGFASLRKHSKAFALLLFSLSWLPQLSNGQGSSFEERKRDILTAIVNTSLPTTFQQSLAPKTTGKLACHGNHLPPQ